MYILFNVFVIHVASSHRRNKMRKLSPATGSPSEKCVDAFFPIIFPFDKVFELNGDHQK